MTSTAQLESTAGRRNSSFAAAPTSTELHALCWKDDWEGASNRMASFRSELMEGDANGIFPLHIAVWHKAPASVVKEMIELAPEAVSKKTTSGYYPLDYAKLFNNEDEEMLAKLEPTEQKEEEEKAAIQDGTQTELHKLCYFKFKPAMARCQTHQIEASYQDENGDLPLHCALEHQAPLNLIEALLQAHPGGAWHKNKAGKLPLHVCAQHWVKVKVLRAVKDAYPAAVNATDNYGELPLVFAQRNAPDQEILQMLTPKDGVTPGKKKWGKHWDEGSQSYYYLNNFTQESTWEEPADFAGNEAAFFNG
ncbi:hypothetical protein TrVE_jg2879 [Triparma verrucosa]|uniref:WW domain-containing protein n=1 Tax=Triparma verrucosa TaxID=1606542 RepID=A0A9W7ET52_9STRA|nr:hypothetical protein TrVE_jg2879 [Triparma verrucosa]